MLGPLGFRVTSRVSFAVSCLGSYKGIIGLWALSGVRVQGPKIRGFKFRALQSSKP